MQAALNTSTRDTPAAHALQVASPLEEALTSICAEAQGVCVVDFEEASDEAVSGLRGRADALLAQSIDLLRFVSAEYVEPAEAAAQEIRAAGDVGDRPSAIPPGVEAIADVLMLAHLGIRSRQRRLAELPSDASRWDVLAALGSSLRTIQKSLAAVRRAMSAAHLVRPAPGYYETALAGSLEVRSLYVRFHRAVAAGGPPDVETLRPRMRRASNAIAVLLGKNNGPHLRTNDRALLFATRESARAWLSGDLSDPEHLLAGQRLFQDITTMAGMLLEVNKREELVRHDALLVRAALAELPPARAWGPVAAVELIARLRPILGRSPEVDALCDASPQALERAVVHQVLAELDAALAVQLHEELGPIAGGRSFEQ